MQLTFMRHLRGQPRLIFCDFVFKWFPVNVCAGPLCTERKGRGFNEAEMSDPSVSVAQELL